MSNFLLCTLVLLTLVGCLEEKKKENIVPPPKPKPVSYNIIIPNRTNDDSSSATVVTIKATHCRSRYYDKPLLRIECYFDGEWISKDNEWEYKGKDVVFTGLVKAFYRADN